MGVVYAGVQRHVERQVAIKLPRMELATDPLVRRQFQMEALAGERIKHRNVVTVLAFGKQAGAPYLVMDPLVGPRLGKLIEPGSLAALPVAMDLIRQILAGLAEAHSLGIVHGDVKCDNVIVETLRDQSLVPRLIDFGLARLVDQPHVPTDGDRMVVGTPDYLAPELVNGGTTSFASDIYAMGILCHELVTGGSPFAGGTSEQVMKRQLHDVAAPMSCRRLGVPPAFDDLVSRALSKAPEDRFVGIGAMAAALEAVTLDDDLEVPQEVRPTSSSDAETSPLRTPAGRAAATRGGPSIDQLRGAVVAAQRSSRVDELIVGYLELARALVDRRQSATAITELEDATMRLVRSDGPVWRLQLTLAALYDGAGERALACAATRAAFDQAAGIGSVIGQQRARALFDRLVRRGGRLPRAAW
jgi:serine/threonine-protein kinase